MKGRALRRHSRQRRIQAEFRKYRRLWAHDEDEAMRSAVRCHNRRKPCSCYVCGSPRKWHGTQTLQETRADVETKDQFDEIGQSFQSRFRSEY